MNFPEPQTERFWRWTPTAQRLLSRLDSRRYLLELQAGLEAGARRSLEL